MTQRKKKKSKKRTFFTLLALVAFGAIVLISVNTFLLTDFEYTANGDELTVGTYSGTDLSDVVIKDSYLINGKEYRTTSIGEGAFKGLAVEKITLPDSIKSIGDKAFQNCTKLKEVKLPSKLESIGKYAFSHCETLRKIDIPGTVREVSDYSFENCKSMKRISLNEGVQIVGPGAFHNTYATNLELPDSLKEIKSSAFTNIDVINLELPNGVQTIGASAFGWNNSLLTVTLPRSVQKISQNAFMNCQRLAVINNLCNIDLKGTFDDNVNPVINKTKNEISTFKVVDDTGSYIFVEKETGYVLVGYDWLSKDCVTPDLFINGEYFKYEIGSCAFNGADMDSIVTSSLVTKINSMSIGNTEATKITIGKNVERIARDAFSGSTNLEYLKFEKSGTWVFRNDDGDIQKSFNMSDPYTNVDNFFDVVGSGYWSK